MKQVYLVVMVVLMAAIMPSVGLADDDVQVCTDSVMTARLNQVAFIVNLGVQKLQTENSKLWQGRPKFRVCDEAELNAFAYPDGRIYVSKGMMEATRGHDDELIAVLNHEATHVLQQHGKAQAKKGIAWRLGTLLVSRLAGASADTADTVSQVATGIAAGGYSRKDERRADEGSVDLCLLEGIDPYAPARMMKMLQTKYGDGSAKAPVIGWFASHPDTGGRTQALRERAKKLVPNASPDVASSIGSVQTAPVKAPTFLGGIAVIVRDNAGGYGGFWGGYGSSEEAIKTTMENALEQTGRFTIVDQSSREEAWQEQDLGDTGRMDPETVPQKGKTVGAKWFLYVTLNYYEVTQQGQVDVGNWNKRANARLVKAEIKGKIKLEPVERSILTYTSDFHGSEIGYEAEASASTWQNGIDISWQSQPAGKAVEQACQKAVNAFLNHVDSSQAQVQTPTKTDRPIATGTVAQSQPDFDRVMAFQLRIKSLPSEGKVEPVTITLNAPYGAVNTADYILFLNKGVVAAKVNIERIRGTEIWGVIEYPYLQRLDISKLQTVQLMKKD
ncbi:MAG: M48 family metalloprotease [Patescibacteria group bacterium]